MTISIPDSVYTTYEEAVDYMIGNFGINCRINYPPIKIECPNCYYNSLPGVGASNVYRVDGPYPFTIGLCPYCNGEGFKETVTTENIKVRVYFDKKTWNKILPNIGVKNGDALIIGYMKDTPKFQNMSFIQLATDVEGYGSKNYTLATNILPWGIKKRRYFYCTLEE